MWHSNKRRLPVNTPIGETFRMEVIKGDAVLIHTEVYKVEDIMQDLSPCSFSLNKTRTPTRFHRLSTPKCWMPWNVNANNPTTCLAFWVFVNAPPPKAWQPLTPEAAAVLWRVRLQAVSLVIGGFTPSQNPPTLADGRGVASEKNGQAVQEESKAKNSRQKGKC